MEVEYIVESMYKLKKVEKYINNNYQYIKITIIIIISKYLKVLDKLSIYKKYYLVMEYLHNILQIYEMDK
jgi:hypothetical protein